MVNPIRVVINDTLVYTFLLEGKNRIDGQVKLEVYNKCSFVHPKLFHVTPSSVRHIQKLFTEVAAFAKDKFYFDKINAVTKNEKFVMMVTTQKASKVAEHEGEVLYEYLMS